MTDSVLKVVVHKARQQGGNVLVLDLCASDDTPLPAFEAGAHVDVHLPDGLVRQYSLCSDPADPGLYRLGVLKDPASRGGSEAVHATLCEGSVVTISAPRNLFPLAVDAQRSLLIGGGIGITPMIAMAYALHARGADFELHYCGRSRSQAAFLQELASAPFSQRVSTHFDDEPAGKLDLNAVLGTAAPGCHVYTCGPSGFMTWVIDAATAAGYGDEQVHREYFQVEVDGSGEAFEVHTARSCKTLQVHAGQSIVQALAEVGIAIDVSCEQGVCGTCLCDVLEGEPDHRDVYLTADEREANDQMLLCCSRARSGRLVLDI
ncbi:PDR/VanB family oxidoreductase [Pseudomonas sp. MF4836]|uniref:PDR/VanB family oxidoreductase n=1 Tax=Pseudomonas sp. MF4836 TaxID=1960827 RepID=UPI0009981BA3|nr:PDR/VanB family oxidoreductase [Pseudomonas sp. MF4836]OOV89740.1 oxidoreductase [Pseudomonas sp. MF4836]